jgi:hypothetical protein
VRAAAVTPHSPPGQEVQTRRRWLPWRPRLRLIFAYPRPLAYLGAGLHRFDTWLGRRFTGPLRPVMVAIFFLPYLAAQFLGLVLVLEITIIAFAASVYLVSAEWLLLALTFPFALAARLASALPWPLSAVAGPRRWTARVSGWNASRLATSEAADALRSGTTLSEPPWAPDRRPALIWK